MGDAPHTAPPDERARPRKRAAERARLGKRVAELEARVADLQKLQKESHAALSSVYRNSEREQRARAERGQSGCEACAQNHGLARRCLSPGTEGPPGDAMQAYDQVHAILLGEHGTRFCTTCRGLEGGSRHAPAWRAVLEPFTCAALGAPQRAGSPPHYVFRPIPIPSAGPSSS